MSIKNNCNYRQSYDQSKCKCSQSSYWMQEPELVFSELTLKRGDCFFDLGCGPGDYSIQASAIIGDSGVVYALDKEKEFIDELKEKAACQGLKNIKAITADINASLPIEDKCVDVCFIATVLHIPNLVKSEKTFFKEIHRVLTPEGRLAIIECKKEDALFGPPMHMRLSPEEIENTISRYGFKKIQYINLGFNYMIQFLIK